jgi:hypothetical protein
MICTSSAASPISSMSSRNSDFLVGLPAAHAALGELPATAAGAPRNEQLAVPRHQHHADVGPKAVAIDHVAHGTLLPRRRGALKPRNRVDATCIRYP